MEYLFKGDGQGNGAQEQHADPLATALDGNQDASLAFGAAAGNKQTHNAGRYQEVNQRWDEQDKKLQELQFSSLPDHERSDIAKGTRSEEHTSELQSRPHLVCRLL